MAAELAIIAKLQDEASSGIRALRGEIEGIEPSTGIASKGFAALQTVGAAALAALAAAAVAVGGAIASSIGVASEFEDQIAILSTAAQGAGTSLDTLRDAAMAVGADTALVGVSASGAADAMTLLYKAGLTTGEIFGDLNGYLSGNVELSGALRAAIDGAAASELSMAAAADLAATTLATFGGHLTTSAERAEFVNVALNNFVQAADASNASVGDLAASMAVIGPTAAQFGFSLQDTNTALALLSTRGIAGSEAGTALKSMFVNLMRPTDDVRGALAELNISLYNADGTMRSMPQIVGDLSQALYGLNETTVITGGRTAEQNHQLELAQKSYNQATDAIYKHEAGLKTLTDSQLQKYVAQQSAANAEIQRLSSVTGTATTAVSQLTEEQRNQYIQTLAGSYGMKAMAVLLMEGVEGWTAMEKAIASAATIQEVAAARTATFSGAMEALSGVVETIQIGIGSAFLPVLTALARVFADMAAEALPHIVGAFEALGGALAMFFDAILAGTNPVTALGDAIAHLAEALGMPAEQAALLKAQIEGVVTAIVNVVGPIAQAITSFVSWKDVLLAVGIAIGSFVIPLLFGIVQAVAPIILVFGGLVLAIAALRNAWESDFLGIRSAVEGAVEIFGRFVEAIRVLTDENARIQAMVDALAKLPEPLQLLAAAVASFINTLRDGGSLVDAFRAGLETLKQAIFDWAGTTNWGEIGGIILDKIAAAFSSLGDRVATTAAGILNWITTSVNSIDWNAVGTAIVNGIAAAITGVVGLLVAGGTAIVNFFSGFFTNDSLQTAGTSLVTALGNAISGAAAGIASGLESIKQAIFDWAGADSWGEVGSAIIDKIAETFRNLGDKVAEVEAGIFNWISEAINGIDWREVGESIINGIVAAITAVVGLLVSAGTAIVNYFVGFFTNDEIAPAAQNLITSLGNAIGEFAGGIVDGLVKVRDAIFNWAGVEDWSGVANKIVEMIGLKLGEAKDAIAAKLGEWQTAIFDWAGTEDWQGVADHIADLIGEKLGEAKDAIDDQLGEWQTAIFDWAGTEDWPGVANHIAELLGVALGEADEQVVAEMDSWYASFVTWAEETDWTGVAATIASALGMGLVGEAMTVTDDLDSWVTAIDGWAGDTDWSGVSTTMAEQIGDGLADQVEAVTEKMSGWIGEFTAWVERTDFKQVGFDIMYKITDAFLDFKTAVTTKVATWLADLKAITETYTWQEIGGYILLKIVEAISGKGGGEGGGEAGVSWDAAVGNWIYEIGQAIVRIQASLQQLGKDIVAGVAAGISAAVDLVTGAFGGVIARILQEGEQRAGAQSPARAFMPLGSDITAGVAVGMIQATGLVVDAIQQIAGQLQTEGAKAFGEAMKALAEGLAAGMNAILDLSAFPGVGGSFLDNLRTVVDMLAQMVAEVAAANTYGEEALKLLGTFVDVAGGIADLMLPLIVALTEIGRFQPINPEAFTAAMEQIAAYLTIAVQHIVAANQYSALVLEGMSAFLEVIQQIADTVAPFLAALVDINAFGTVDLWFFHEGIAQLWYTMLLVVQKVQELAVLGEQTLERMEGFLEVVQAMADTIGPFIAALYELNAFGTVDLHFFHEGLAQLAYVMLMVVGALAEANTFGTAALEAVKLFAETAGAIAEMIGPMIEGLISINALDGTMNEVAYHAVYFRNGVRALVDALASAAALFTTGTLQHVQQFAETAGAIADIIVPAVEGLMIIGTLTGDLNYIGIQATYFRNGLRTIVSALASAAELFTAALLNQVQLFAETAGAIMDLVGPAIEGFALISTLTGEVNYIGIQATYLRNGLRTIVSAIASAAELFTAGLLTHTQLFADTAGAIVELIAEAIEALALLANYVAAAGLEAAAAAFAADLTSVINIIVDALREAGLLANEAITQAADLADGLGDILGMVEDGVDALTALAAYVSAANLASTAQQFAADLATAINAIVSGLQEAGVLTDASIVAAADLADGLSDVLGMVEDGVDALTALAGYVPNANIIPLAQQFAADLAAALIAVADGLRAAGVLADSAIVAAGDLADALGDVLGMVEDGVDALTALAGYVPSANLVPTAQQFAADLATVITTIVAALQQAGILADAAITAAGEMADEMADVLSMVEDGVGALVELAGYVPGANLVPTAQQFAADLATVITAVVTGLQQAQLLANQAVVEAGELADGLANILGVVGDGVEAITALAAYVPGTGIQAKAQQFAADLATVITAIVNGLVQAGLLADQAVERAGELAGSLGELLGVVVTGIEAINAIAEYKSVKGLAEKVAAFAADLVTIAATLTASLTAAAQAIGQEAMSAATQFATDAEAILSAVNEALTALVAIGEHQLANGLSAKIQTFAQELINTTTYLALGLGSAAAQLGQQVITAATAFATDAAAILIAVNEALTALVAIGEHQLANGLSAKIQVFAQELIAITTYLALGMGTAAAQLGQQVITDALAFAADAKAILDAVGVALTALVAIGEHQLANGLSAKIQAFAQELINTTTYLALGMGSAAAQLGEQVITDALAFAADAKTILDAVGVALTAMTAIGEHQLTSGLSAKIQAFAQELIAITTYLALGLGSAAAQLGEAVIAAALSFAAHATTIAQAVDTALQAIAAIAANEDVAGMSGRIQSLGQELVAIATFLATSLAAAAQHVTADIVAAATQFAISVAALAVSVGNAVNALGEIGSIATPDVAPKLTYLVTSAQLIQQAFTAAGDIGAAVTYAEAFRANLQQLVAEIQQAVALLAQIAGTSTTGSIGAALAAIAASLQNTTGQFAGAGTVLAQALIAALTAGINAGQSSVQGATVYMLEAVRAAGENVGRNFTSVGNEITDALSSSILSGQGQVIAAVTQVINAAIAAGVAAARGASAVGQQLVQAALTEINNGRGQLDSAGSAAGDALITGMARAITNGKSRVVNAIIATVNAAIAAAKNALGIASPSKVAIDLLSNFMNTAARTVEGLRGKLADSMATAVSGAAAAAATGLRGVQLSPAMSPAFVGPALSDSLGERAAFAAVGRGRAAEASGANHTQVVFYGNVVLPNVTDSRSFLEELDALRGGA